MRKSIIALVVLAACGGSNGRLVDVRFDVSGRTRVIRAEVADSDAEQAHGLMERETLRADQGMLFVWSVTKSREFYMFKTLIPLDVIAIRAGRVAGVYGMVPCRDTDPAKCPRTDVGEVDAALEVNAGTAARLGLVPGVLVDAEVLAGA